MRFYFIYPPPLRDLPDPLYTAVFHRSHGVTSSNGKDSALVRAKSLKQHHILLQIQILNARVPN